MSASGGSSAAWEEPTMDVILYIIDLLAESIPAALDWLLASFGPVYVLVILAVVFYPIAGIFRRN